MTDDSAPAESMTPPPRDPLDAWHQAIFSNAPTDQVAERNGVNVRAANAWLAQFVGQPTGSVNKL